MAAPPTQEEPAIEPAFDLSIEDVDVSPLEGLESNADPSQFNIDPEAGDNGVEGLISADSGLSLSDRDALSPTEPGLGEPLSTEDPLAGLSILEDDRFNVHETASTELAPEPVEAEAAPAAEEVVEGIDTLDLHVEEPGLPGEVVVHDEPSQPEPEPVRPPTPARAAARPTAKTPLREPQRAEPPRPPVEEEQPEEIAEEEVEEERPAAKAKPKLVESPLRITRPKKKPKTPVPTTGN
jgi:hypothetical protein